MIYKTTKQAPTELNNFLGLSYEVSKIDGDEPYPVATKIYQKQDKTFQVTGFGICTLEELEQIFEMFMYCEVE